MGAFAELAAYDYLNQDLLNRSAFLHDPIQPNVTLPNTRSFAIELQKHETNVDGFIDDFNLYFDVKCLKDNVKEILDDIFGQIKRVLKVSDFHISPEYDLHVSYSEF